MSKRLERERKEAVSASITSAPTGLQRGAHGKGVTLWGAAKGRLAGVQVIQKEAHRLPRRKKTGKRRVECYDECWVRGAEADRARRASGCVRSTQGGDARAAAQGGDIGEPPVRGLRRRLISRQSEVAVCRLP